MKFHQGKAMNLHKLKIDILLILYNYIYEFLRLLLNKPQ